MASPLLQAEEQKEHCGEATGHTLTGGGVVLYQVPWTLSSLRPGISETPPNSYAVVAVVAVFI